MEDMDPIYPTPNDIRTVCRGLQLELETNDPDERNHYWVLDMGIGPCGEREEVSVYEHLPTPMDMVCLAAHVRSEMFRRGWTMNTHKADSWGNYEINYDHSLVEATAGYIFDPTEPISEACAVIVCAAEAMNSAG